MTSINKEPLILNTDNEVGVVSGYNAAVCAAGKNQIAAATGAYCVATTIKEGSLAVVTGEHGVVTALKENSLVIGWGGTTKVKGVLNSFIAAAELTPEGDLNIQLRKVDGVSIMPDTWYSLINGELRKIE